MPVGNINVKARYATRFGAFQIAPDMNVVRRQQRAA
jgi:hypothetical protein